MSGAFFHANVREGLQTMQRSDAITYFGVTYRIPRCDYNTMRQLEWERPPNELCQPVEQTNGQTLEPDMTGVIERFETFDQSNGDVLVMYRIPYRQTAR